MATYNVVSGKSQTLGAATVDIVNFSRPADRVTIQNTAATNPIYANIGSPALPFGQTPAVAAATPTVGGDNSTIVVPPLGTFTYPPPGSPPAMIGSVALISAGAQTYTVSS